MSGGRSALARSDILALARRQRRCAGGAADLDPRHRDRYEGLPVTLLQGGPHHSECDLSAARRPVGVEGGQQEAHRLVVSDVTGSGLLPVQADRLPWFRSCLQSFRT